MHDFFDQNDDAAPQPRVLNTYEQASLMQINMRLGAAHAEARDFALPAMKANVDPDEIVEQLWPISLRIELLELQRAELTA